MSKLSTNQQNLTKENQTQKAIKLLLEIGFNPEESLLISNSLKNRSKKALLGEFVDINTKHYISKIGETAWKESQDFYQKLAKVKKSDRDIIKVQTELSEVQKVDENALKEDAWKKHKTQESLLIIEFNTLSTKQRKRSLKEGKVAKDQKEAYQQAIEKSEAEILEVENFIAQELILGKTVQESYIEKYTKDFIEKDLQETEKEKESMLLKKFQIFAMLFDIEASAYEELFEEPKTREGLFKLDPSKKDKILELTEDQVFQIIALVNNINNKSLNVDFFTKEMVKAKNQSQKIKEEIKN